MIKGIKTVFLYLKNRNDKSILLFLFLLIFVENVWRWYYKMNPDLFNSIIKYLVAFPLYEIYVFVGEMRREIRMIKDARDEREKDVAEIKMDIVDIKSMLSNVDLRFDELKESVKGTERAIFKDIGKQDITIEKIEKKAKDISLLKLLFQQLNTEMANVQEFLNKNY